MLYQPSVNNSARRIFKHEEEEVERNVCCVPVVEIPSGYLTSARLLAHREKAYHVNNEQVQVLKSNNNCYYDDDHCSH